VGDEDRFCEACGADLPVGPAASMPVEPEVAGCVTCGGAVGDDGYCGVCGLKQPDPHDREELDLGWAAGVSDRGLHHPTNEDAMFLSAPRPGMAVAVVCDGVSSSSNAMAAAGAAARAAGPVLLDTAGTDPKAAIAEAAAAAQQAVIAVPRVGDGESPSCTFVAAALRDGELTVGWLGDSRAYWLSPSGNRRLTTDDSWAAMQVDAGVLTEEAAEADPRAHSITGWLGADAPVAVPRVTQIELAGPGRVVVCSDGLWNYASDADRLAGLLEGSPPDAVGAARHLAQFALDSGGHDNITVVVLAVGERTP